MTAQAVLARWPNLMIRASAGTGKTFQLSNRYLQLAADGQAEQILAFTFARKAAGEILDRVLFRLAQAAPQRSPAPLPGRPARCPLAADDCHALLGRMLDELHRLRIGTLDSFRASWPAASRWN